MEFNAPSPYEAITGFSVRFSWSRFPGQGFPNQVFPSQPFPGFWPYCGPTPVIVPQSTTPNLSVPAPPVAVSKNIANKSSSPVISLRPDHDIGSDLEDSDEEERFSVAPGSQEEGFTSDEDDNSVQIINDGIVSNESQFSQVSGFGLASFSEQFRSKDYEIFDLGKLVPKCDKVLSSTISSKPADGLRLTQSVWSKTENLLRNASHVLGTAEHFLSAKLPQFLKTLLFHQRSNLSYYRRRGGKSLMMEVINLRNLQSLGLKPNSFKRGARGPIPLPRKLPPQVETLLTKRAVEEVPVSSIDPGFYSRLFLVSKKTGGMRPVHRFVYPQLLYDYSPFQNGDQSFNKSFYSSRYVDNIPDLTDAIFMFPVCHSYRKFLRFVWNKKGLPVQGSPFWSVNCTTSLSQTYAGSNCSPSFTGYSDSFLPGRLTDQGTFSRETLSQYRCSHQIAALSGVSHFLEKVGPHSVSGLYFPRRTLPYSSVHSSTSSGKVSESLFKNSSVSISKNSHCSPVFTTARSLKFSSRCCSTWSPSHSTSSILSTPTLAPSYTELGVSSSNHSSGIVSSFGLVDFSSKRFERPTSVLSPVPNQTLFTDASNLGWGAYLEGLSVSGVWTPDLLKEHINILEMKAVLLALSHFQSLLQNKSLVLATDNTTVFRHVPGKLNVLADALSRTLTPVNTEWELLQSVFQAITLQWGSPHVDLFATSLNYKIQVFMSPVPDPKAYAVDCMSVPWDGMFAYAFPPFRFLSQVLRKISAEQGLIILIAPAWPKQAWFPDLLHLSCARPLVLPVRHNLLSQFKGKILSSQSREATSVRVASLRDSFKERGFSECAARHLSRAVRDSTNIVYDAKWTIFSSWCSGKEIDPFQISVQQLADFLIHLFEEKGLSPSTIKGYRSAISRTILLSGGPDFGNDEFISLLVKNFTLERPRQRVLIPSWNLSRCFISFKKPSF
ncbi:Hypothetical predicted protein [Mytilus galloprovincialis]|uniref:Core-binding (CB) domain-containing protein n=1 Tax=Mytilus galloprovincialis TaxID=29158 RepID=A0A8B6FBS9_MYTGA|nr:Hypothetical predicted protein [Mytilus galloprovincialis]